MNDTQMAHTLTDEETHDAESAPERPGRKWAGRLLAVVVSALVTLLVAELATRAIAPVPLHATDTFLAVGDEKRREADRSPRWLRPNITARHTEEDFSVTVAINSKGLRDREIPYGKPPGVARVLSLGDSFAFGYGVELEEAYCKVAESALGEGWEVINAATPSWGTADELDFLVSEGVRYEPDVIVVCFFRNDLRDNRVRESYQVIGSDKVERLTPLETDMRPSEDFKRAVLLDPILREICEGGSASGRELAKPRVSWWALHSNLYRLGRQAFSRMSQSKRADAMEAELSRRSEEERRLAGALLAEITRRAAEEGAATVVLLLPSRSEAKASRGDSFREGLRDVTGPSASLGARVVDLAPALREAGVAQVYFQHNAHLNARGHRVVGNLLADELRRIRPERQVRE